MQNMAMASVAAFLTQLPELLVWLAGIGWAIFRWQYHPKVSRLTLIALIGMILLTTISGFLAAWLPFWLIQSGMSSGQMGMVLGGMRILQVILGAVIWTVVLVAIFGWRRCEKAEAG